MLSVTEQLLNARRSTRTARCPPGADSRVSILVTLLDRPDATRPMFFARYSDSSALCIRSSALTLPAARSAIAIPTETVTVMSAARECRVR